MTPRQRRIVLANEVRDALPYPRHWFALAWTDDVDVIARIRRDDRYVYGTFPFDEDTLNRIVAWAHADSPRTS